MSTFRKITILIGFLWRNRHRLSAIKTEIEEAINAVQLALEDKNITKDELKKIVKECKDILQIIETILI